MNAFAENREAEKYERDYLSRVFDSETGWREQQLTVSVQIPRDFSGLEDIPDYTDMMDLNSRNIFWMAELFQLMLSWRIMQETYGSEQTEKGSIVLTDLIFLNIR